MLTLIGCVISGGALLAFTYSLGWDRGLMVDKGIAFDLKKMEMAIEQGPEYFKKYSLVDNKHGH